MHVNSHLFGGDPCPGTRKYVEVHYACSAGRGGDDKDAGRTLPPWLYENGALDLWEEQAAEDETLTADGQNGDDPLLDYDGGGGGGGEDGLPRRPILVQHTTTPPLRIPITTPRPTTTTSTTTTTTPTTTAWSTTSAVSVRDAGESAWEWKRGVYEASPLCA